MKHRLLLAVISALFSVNLIAAQITVCIIDAQVANNPQYYHLPNTATQLVCEIPDNTKQTLATLYQNGWRLIQVVNVDSRYQTKDNAVPSALLYFEKYF